METQMASDGREAGAVTHVNTDGSLNLGRRKRDAVA